MGSAQATSRVRDTCAKLHASHPGGPCAGPALASASAGVRLCPGRCFNDAGRGAAGAPACIPARYLRRRPAGVTTGVPAAAPLVSRLLYRLRSASVTVRVAVVLKADNVCLRVCGCARAKVSVCVCVH